MVDELTASAVDTTERGSREEWGEIPHPPPVAAVSRYAPPTSHVYASGIMAGLEAAPISSSWRPSTELAYPFDLPDKRRVRMDYPLGWFAIRKIPVVAEQVQADTYLTEGEIIRPVRLDGDRRGYVIAVADTNLEALDRAEAAARLIDVEVEPV